MHANPDGLFVYARGLRGFHDYVAADGVGIKRSVERASTIVADRPKEGRVEDFAAPARRASPPQDILR
jgi:hypothetical protein